MNTVVTVLGTIWNAIPAVVGVANEVVHGVHESLHALAQALTITLK